jgi:hypothetical protein
MSSRFLALLSTWHLKVGFDCLFWTLFRKFLLVSVNTFIYILYFRLKKSCSGDYLAEELNKCLRAFSIKNKVCFITRNSILVSNGHDY